MEDCVFCGIVGKKIPADIVYEDDDVVVFPDRAPLAPVHLLAVPKRHIGAVTELGENQAELVGRIILAAAQAAAQATDGNFTLAINAGDRLDVDHFHVHIKGERKGGDGA